MLEKGTEIRGDKHFIESLGDQSQIKTAEQADWDTEYLANILSIKTVESMDEAIQHIDQQGSHHSECIISEDDEACQKFLTQVDSSCVMVNASTRFNDGSQLGLGAELGISTTKLHAYGPMGIEQMTTSRYAVVGDVPVRG